MRNMMILAGAAALAITAPVLAQPGKGGGGGGNKGGGGPAKVERGGGGGGGGQRAGRGGGGGPAMQMRGPERREVRVERRAEQPQRKMERGPVREVREVRRQEVRGNARQEVRGNERKVRVAEERGRGNADRRSVERMERNDARTVSVEQRQDLVRSPAFRTTGLINGCPPGLAAKNNDCLPPGQAKKRVGAVLPAALGTALLPPLVRNYYPDSEEYLYRTSDGYVYRIDRDRNLVDAFWPLADQWDGNYYVGAAYPQDYLGYYNVPVQYQPWYADSGDNYYRYADGAIYQVDRSGGMIESIVSLLAGGMAIGQPLPLGYDVYNVPYAYRDRYVDTADNWYRYNDGYIYQVDPTTRVVQAIVETLV